MNRRRRRRGHGRIRAGDRARASERHDEPVLSPVWSLFMLLLASLGLSIVIGYYRVYYSTFGWGSVLALARAVP